MLHVDASGTVAMPVGLAGAQLGGAVQASPTPLAATAVPLRRDLSGPGLVQSGGQVSPALPIPPRTSPPGGGHGMAPTLWVSALHTNGPVDAVPAAPGEAATPLEEIPWSGPFDF